MPDLADAEEEGIVVALIRLGLGPERRGFVEVGEWQPKVDLARLMAVLWLTNTYKDA
jgi:hypothetical protein